MSNDTRMMRLDPLLPSLMGAIRSKMNILYPLNTGCLLGCCFLEPDIYQYLRDWGGVEPRADLIRTWFGTVGGNFEEGGSSVWRIGDDTFELTVWASFILRFVPTVHPGINEVLTLLSGLLEMGLPATRSLLESVNLDNERLMTALRQRGIIMTPDFTDQDAPLREHAYSQLLNWCVVNENEEAHRHCLLEDDHSAMIDAIERWLESQYCPVSDRGQILPGDVMLVAYGSLRDALVFDLHDTWRSLTYSEAEEMLAVAGHVIKRYRPRDYFNIRDSGQY